MQKVKTAIFPVAGLGTRFLPATKASPKEMLPIVDKPLIQYAVEEAVEAGMETLVFITGRNKRAIEDHFDKAYELETELEKAGKADLLELVRQTEPKAECLFIRQREARGLGDAVHCAHAVCGNEPFAVLLADDFISNENGDSALKQMVQRFNTTGNSIISVERVPKEEIFRYGVVEVEPKESRLHRVKAMVEKPPVEEAPSDLAVVGRYILSPRVMQLLGSAMPGRGGEIQLTDAIAKSLDNEIVLAYEYTGKRYDCGSKIGYLIANIEVGIKHDEIGLSLADYLHDLDI